MAVQVYVGGEFETAVDQELTTLVDLGLGYGVPTWRDGGRQQLTRDARYLGLAHGICAELGAQVVKKTILLRRGVRTRHGRLPVPIVMAGGKKLPELEALTMATRGDPGRRRGRHGPQTSSSPTRRPR